MQHRVTVQGCLHRPELGDDGLKGGPLSRILVPALLHQLNVLVVQPQLAPRRLLSVWDFWPRLIVHYLNHYLHPGISNHDFECEDKHEQVLVPALLHQLNVLVVQPQLAPRRLLPVWDFWTCLVVNHLYTYIELLIMGFCLCD